MIHVPTAAWAHTVVDLTAWTSGLAFGAALYRRRLKAAVERVATHLGLSQGMGNVTPGEGAV